MSAPDINNLIPQKSPMVMVDEHVSTEGNKTTTALFIREDNIFCNKGQLTEPGLIENMAQSAALRTGFLFSKKMTDSNSIQKPPIGFIGGIKKLHIHILPQTGETIQTTIEIEAEIMNALVVKAVITRGAETVAECELKIFLEE